MLTTVEAHYDGTQIVIDDDISLENGQKLIVTLLSAGHGFSKTERNVAYLKKIRDGFAQVRSGCGQIHELVEAVRSPS